jgi:hypothetical protein
MSEFPEFVSPAVPDRADQPVSETTERFLRAIVERVPLERIEELHLFSPLRQGTVETGIAVIAGVVLVPNSDSAPATESEPEPLELSLDESGADDVEFDPYAAELHEEAEAGTEAAPDFEAVLQLDAATGEVNEPIIDEPSIDEPIIDEPMIDEPMIDEPIVAERTPVERHTVYTARYRLVIKGPERGRWEADLVEEADAPLVTVETVVRGVQRRAGEDTEIVRYNAHQIARALRIPAS